MTTDIQRFTRFTVEGVKLQYIGDAEVWTGHNFTEAIWDSEAIWDYGRSLTLISPDIDGPFSVIRWPYLTKPTPFFSYAELNWVGFITVKVDKYRQLTAAVYLRHQQILIPVHDPPVIVMTFILSPLIHHVVWDECSRFAGDALDEQDRIP
jgi:hypothetical protein